MLWVQAYLHLAVLRIVGLLAQVDSLSAHLYGGLRWDEEVHIHAVSRRQAVHHTRYHGKGTWTVGIAAVDGYVALVLSLLPVTLEGCVFHYL